MVDVWGMSAKVILKCCPVTTVLQMSSELECCPSFVVREPIAICFKGHSVQMLASLQSFKSELCTHLRVKQLLPPHHYCVTANIL